LSHWRVDGVVSSRKEARSGRTKDFLMYIAIAITIAIAASIFGFHQGKTGGSSELPLKWMGFAGMTGVVFGYCLRACRREWGVPRFWLILGIFFTIHTILGIIILLSAQAIPLVTFGVLTGVEYVILGKYLDFFMRRKKATA
jgi:hypothetical protein